VGTIVGTLPEGTVGDPEVGVDGFEPGAEGVELGVEGFELGVEEVGAVGCDGEEGTTVPENITCCRGTELDDTLRFLLLVAR